MKKILYLIFAMFAIMTWQACEYDWLQPEPVILPDEVSFSGDIIPIFEAHCTGCHTTGGISPDLTAANAYADLFAEGLIDIAVPENSLLYTKIAPGGSMNQYTSPGDAALVLQWIKEGALNN